MSLIRKPQELVLQNKIKALLYGQPGVGKTTLALSSPKPLLIDCDGGIQRIRKEYMTDTVQVSSYQDVLDVILKEDLSTYETIVIDTGGKLLDYMASYIILNNSKMGRSNGMLTLQGYGERKAEFVNFCQLITKLKKHLLFVAHRQTIQEGDNYRYVPLFGGSNYDALVTELDLVGYMEANGTTRIITFDPTDRNDGKNTCELPHIIQLPVLIDSNNNAKPNTFLTKNVIEPYIERIKSIEGDVKEYSSLIDKIKEDLQVCTGALTLNKFCEDIDKNYEHIGASKKQAALLVAERAKELGVEYDKQNKCYCDGTLL